MKGISMASAFDKLNRKNNIDNINTSSGAKKPRVEEFLSLMDFSDGGWHRVRLIPGVFTFARMWIDIKKKDGTKISIPLVLRNVDMHTGSFDSTIPCPYMENRDRFKSGGEPGGRVDSHFYMNLIDREEQENEPKKTGKTKEEKKSGFKDKSSSSWTPVRVARFPKTVVEKIQKLQQMNKSGKGKTHNISDPRYGIDIMVMYDAKADGASKWDVQLCNDKDARKPLKEKEKNYLYWDIEEAINTVKNHETEEDAIKNVENLLKRDENNGSRKKGNKMSKKAKKEEISSEEESSSEESSNMESSSEKISIEESSSEEVKKKKGKGKKKKEESSEEEISSEESSSEESSEEESSNDESSNDESSEESSNDESSEESSNDESSSEESSNDESSSEESSNDESSSEESSNDESSDESSEESSSEEVKKKNRKKDKGKKKGKGKKK